MTQRTILTPTNLYYRLKEMMSIIYDQLPDHYDSNREVWSQETEDAFNNFRQSFRKDLEKANKSNSNCEQINREFDNELLGLPYYI